MPQAVDSLASLIEELSERLRDLEHRVAALESTSVMPSGAGASRSEPPAHSSDPYPAARARDTWGALPTGIFPTLGKAVLGLAGAFLLRAITESGSVPKLPVIFVAIFYAFSWMLWAIHPKWLPHPEPALSKVEGRFSQGGNFDRFSSATYSVTACLILSPLLWEATVRFQVLSPALSSLILVAFLAMTLALSASRNLQLIPWIATLSSVATALALIIATRELVPLTGAVLAIAFATEVSVCFDHQLTFRAIPAVLADFCLWLVISILASETIPEGYHAVAPSTIILLCVLLATIYAASIAIRSFIQLRPVTIFQIMQSAASFALSTYGIVHVTQNSAAFALGIVFLLLAFICYWGTLSRFADDTHMRNRRVSASWAAALLLAGTFLLFPSNLQIPVLCLAAVLTAIVYIRTGKASLGLHASFYIAAAFAVSPMPIYFASALAGSSIPSAPASRVWIVAVAAALCYTVESHGSNDQGRRRLLWIVPASVVAFTITAWMITAIVRIVSARLELAPSHLSMIRTIVICAMALCLAIASRPRHVELGWIAYAAVALGTLKLVAEDLRFGNPASLVVSFLFYGLILILLPRLTKETAKDTAGS